MQLPTNSPATRLIGIDALTPEKSTNFSVGLVARAAQSVKFSLDLYQISLRDRIVGSGTLFGTFAGKLMSSAVNAAIVTNGNVLEDVPFSGVNVFNNGVDSRTRGADFVLSWGGSLAAGNFNGSLAANYNRTQVTRIKATPAALAASGQSLLDVVAISTLEEASPRFKTILTGTYAQGPLSLRLRNTLYGQSSRIGDFGDGTRYVDRTGMKLITDLDLSWRVARHVTLSASANNLFNVFPDRLNAAVLAATAAAGNPAVEIYPNFSPFGINGGYYFARLGVDF